MSPKQNKQIKKIINDSLTDLIGTEKEIKEKIDELTEKHKQKNHFAPIKYRVLGGFLQSLNIRFGNFLETLLASIIEKNNNYSVLLVSKKKDLRLSKDCERAIDSHINHSPESTELLQNIDQLYEKIFSQNSGLNNKERLDIDLLIKDKKTEIYYYIEVKYNDDHDTGKFKDINRKALKTYAGLVNDIEINNKDKFRFMLYYFNPHKRYYPSPYLRDGVEVFRGQEIFDKLHLNITYQEVVVALDQFSVEIEDKFDSFAKRIFSKFK